VRFHFDERKSRSLRRNPRRGIGFEEAQEVFFHPYYADQRSDVPVQHRAIGWVGDRLYSVIFEIREDAEGEFDHLVTLWKATRAEQNSMKNTTSKKKAVPAESIARMADRGKDVSRFFTNSGEMRKPIQRVNIDFTASMLEELERAAKELNVSRQAVIKTLIRQGLDQRQIARTSRGRTNRS